MIDKLTATLTATRSTISPSTKIITHDPTPERDRRGPVWTLRMDLRTRRPNEAARPDAAWSPCSRWCAAILPGIGTTTFSVARHRSGQLSGMPLACASMTYPKGYSRRRYEGGDSSSSLLTTGTCSQPLWRKNDTRRTSQPRPATRQEVRHEQHPTGSCARYSARRRRTADIQEVADVVRVPVATLRYWRHLGTGPRSFRIGRSGGVCYDVSMSTSEPGRGKRPRSQRWRRNGSKTRWPLSFAATMLRRRWRG
jgi:hypothetical protein